MLSEITVTVAKELVVPTTKMIQNKSKLKTNFIYIKKSTIK